MDTDKQHTPNDTTERTEEETRPLTEEDHERARRLAKALLRGGDKEEVS